jgi:hypothetical protein
MQYYQEGITDKKVVVGLLGKMGYSTYEMMVD